MDRVKTLHRTLRPNRVFPYLLPRTKGEFTQSPPRVTIPPISATRNHSHPRPIAICRRHTCQLTTAHARGKGGRKMLLLGSSGTCSTRNSPKALRPNSIGQLGHQRREDRFFMGRNDQEQWSTSINRVMEGRGPPQRRPVGRNATRPYPTHHGLKPHLSPNYITQEAWDGPPNINKWINAGSHRLYKRLIHPSRPFTASRHGARSPHRL